MTLEKIIFEQGNLFESEDIQEEKEERICKHNLVKEECGYCKKVFDARMLKLQRQQKVRENNENIGITLLGIENTESGYKKHWVPSTDYSTGRIKGKNKEVESEDVDYRKKVRWDIKRKIWFTPRSTEKLNSLLKEHFGVTMKVNPETHYPDQQTITIRGVKCNIRSDSHRPGFYLKVPFKKTNPKKNNTNTLK